MEDDKGNFLGPSYERAFLWPDVKRQVFRSNTTPYGANVGSYRDAGPSSFRHLYRRSYEVAVEALQQEAYREQRCDLFVLPLMFLWRHLIEVTLKDLIREFRGLFFEDPTENEANTLKGHDLRKLWKIAKPHLRQLGCGGDELANVEVIMEEIQSVDPYADGFRYPFRRDGETKNLQDLPSSIDFEALNESLRGAFNFLSTGFDEIQRCNDFFTDFEVAMARAHGWPELDELRRARRAYFEGAGEDASNTSTSLGVKKRP